MPPRQSQTDRVGRREQRFLLRDPLTNMSAPPGPSSSARFTTSRTVTTSRSVRYGCIGSESTVSAIASPMRKIAVAVSEHAAGRLQMKRDRVVDAAFDPFADSASEYTSRRALRITNR